MEILTSCIIYLICFSCPSIIVLFSKKLDKHVKTLLILTSLIPAAFLTTYRYDIATDYHTYNSIFNYVKDFSTSEILFSHYPREIGFKMIIKMFRGFSNHYIFGVFGLLTFLPVVYLLKIEIKQSCISLSIALFLYMFYFYPISLNTLRQCLACSFVFVGTNFLFKNKKGLFYIFLILAVGFHYTAVIASIIPVLWNTKQNKTICLRKYLFIIAIIILVLLTWQLILTSLGIKSYLMYATRQSAGSNNTFLIKIGFIFLCFLFRKQLIKYDYRNALYLNLNYLSVLIYSFGYLYPYIIRSAWYFDYSSIWLVSSLPFVVSKNNLIRIICLLIIISFCLFWFFGVECGLAKGNITTYLPVKFVF